MKEMEERVAIAESQVEEHSGQVEDIENHVERLKEQQNYSGN